MDENCKHIELGFFNFLISLNGEVRLLKIEVWSDFICPYCYKGKRILEDAISKFKYRDEIEIIYRSYILSPDASKENHQLVNDMLLTKYGMSIDEINAENQRLIKKAKTLGLDYSRINNLYDINTIDAHRVAHYAKKHNLSLEWTETLMDAHFVKGLLIDDHEVLISLAKQIGLNELTVRNILQTDQYGSEVRQDMAEADTIGVETVPFFAINRSYAISGVVTSKEFLDAINLAYEQNK